MATSPRMRNGMRAQATSTDPALVITRRSLVASLLAAAMIGGLVAATATVLVLNAGADVHVRRSTIPADFRSGTAVAPSGESPSPVAPSTPTAPLLGSPSPTSIPTGSNPGPTAEPAAPGSSGASPATTSSVSPSVASAAPASVASAAPAPASSAPASAGADPFAVIIAVAERVRPAVVTILTSAPDPFGGTSTGVGSGMIFDTEGWILTNAHVVAGASELTVKLTDGRSFSGRVVASDLSLDLAVVKVRATALPVVTLGSSAGLRPGQLVIAIGSPLGDFTDSVTSGILSATGRAIDVGSRRRPQHLTNLLQVDAPINPGNSGGPLLDANGDVIGINVAVDPNGQGIAFAIPIDAARSIMERALAAG